MKDRIFNTVDGDGKELVLVFKRPNQKVLTKAELVYRESYSDAFRRGLLLHSEVINAMKKRGIWNDEKEDEAEEMKATISQAEEELKNQSLSKEEGEEVCARLTKLRDELMAHNRVLTSVTDNTIESVAGEGRNQFLTSACIYNNKTGKKVYKDMDDFKNRLDEEATIKSYHETIIASLEIIVGRDLSSDLTDEYPENEWLKSREDTETVTEPSDDETVEESKAS